MLIGKPLGVILLCMLAVACRVSSLPEGSPLAHIVGAGLLGGIGFTMSIFITNLAFAELSERDRFFEARRLAASLIAGILGFIWLRLSDHKNAPELQA